MRFLKDQHAARELVRLPHLQPLACRSHSSDHLVGNGKPIIVCIDVYLLHRIVQVGAVASDSGIDVIRAIGTLATVDTVCTHTCITDTCITRCTRFVSQVTIIVAGSFERRFTASCVCAASAWRANDRLLAKLSAEGLGHRL